MVLIFFNSNSIGVSMPRLEWRRRRLWKISMYSKIAGLLERGLVRDRRALLLAALDAFQPLGVHQARDSIATDVDVASAQFLRRFADAVHAPVALARRVDLGDEPLVFERVAGRFPGPAQLGVLFAQPFSSSRSSLVSRSRRR